MSGGAGTPKLPAGYQAKAPTNYACSNTRISLACPHCQTQGSVDWTALSRALDCPECSCRFVVLRDGQTIPLERLRQTRFKCPRCNSSGSIAEVVAAHGAKCRVCQLPLELAPDGRLYCREEAQRIRFEMDASKANWGRFYDRVAMLFSDSLGKIRWDRVATAGFLALAVLLGAFLYARSAFDESPAARTERLVRHCFANQVARSERFVEDDPVQLVELERWRMRRFASLRDAFRPKGDYVAIESTLLRELDGEQEFQVIVKSRWIGVRKWKMTWRQVGDNWYFDAIATLAAEDRLPSRSSRSVGNALPKSRNGTNPTGPVGDSSRPRLPSTAGKK